MKNLFIPLSLLILLTFGPRLSGQGIVDGFFSPQGELSLSAGYTRGTADDFYFGTRRQGHIPAHGEFTQDIYSIYAKYGLLDDLTLVATVPFVSISGAGDADPVNGLTETSDFQDVQLALKHRVASVRIGGGNLDFLGSVAGTLAGGYEANGILSIGSGANAVALRAGAHYTAPNGLFATAVGGYSLRGAAENPRAEIQGGSDFDVPNAWVGVAKVGYAGGKFYTEGFFDFQHSTDGVDIGGEGFGGNFPATRVNFARIGATVYYPVIENLGVSLGYSTIVDGRNVANTTYFNAGVTFTIR